MSDLDLRDLESAAWRVLLDPFETRHPGHPDQKVHGRKGPRTPAKKATAKAAKAAAAAVEPAPKPEKAPTGKPPAKPSPRKGRKGPVSSVASRWLTPDEAMAMREKMLADNPWTDDKKEALNVYTGSDYYQMNGLLRRDQMAVGELGESERAKYAALIRDAAAGMRPTTQPVKVKRFVAGYESFGIDMSEMTRTEAAEALRGMKGKVLQEPGFMSTSLSEEFGKGKPDSRFKIELEVPPGAQGAYLDGDIGFEREQELLLAPGTRFEVTDVVIDPPEKTVKGRVVVS